MFIKASHHCATAPTILSILITYCGPISFFLLKSTSDFIFTKTFMKKKTFPTNVNKSTLYTFFFGLLLVCDSHILWWRLKNVVKDENFLFFIFRGYLLTTCHIRVFIYAFTNLSIYPPIFSALSVSFLVVAACWHC